MGNEFLTTIPRLRRVIYDLYANFPITGLDVGDLAFATDTLILYRWSGGAWQAITSAPGVEVQIAYKTANEVVNNSSVLQDDDELTIPVAANASYEFFAIITYQNTNANSGLKYLFTIPAGATLMGARGEHIAAITDEHGATLIDFETQVVLGPGYITTKADFFWGTYIGAAAAGNILFRWAQNTAIAADTLIHAGSFIRLIHLT